METDERARRGAGNREAVDLLIHVMRQHHRIVERRIDGLGVHHSQHRMLMRLSNMGRSPSQKDIAKALDVSPACVARTLKALSAAGLIDKAEAADGRCNEISILPDGQRLIDDSIKVFGEIDAEMFDGVSDEQMAALILALRRIRQNLVRMEQEAITTSERSLPFP